NRAEHYWVRPLFFRTPLRRTGEGATRGGRALKVALHTRGRLAELEGAFVLLRAGRLWGGGLTGGRRPRRLGKGRRRSDSWQRLPHHGPGRAFFLPFSDTPRQAARPAWRAPR